MTDMQPVVDDAALVTDADPEDGEPVERIQLVHTGLIRVWVAGERFRLRRPFMGEFKRLRLALEDIGEEVNDQRLVAERAGRDVIADMNAWNAQDPTPDPDATAEHERGLRAKSRATAVAFNDAVDEARIGWWRDVFATLSLDGAPAEDRWPSWALDAQLPQQIVTHWRSTPLGRG